MVMPMDWNDALRQAIVAPRQTCTLIVVGETKEGQAFCYEGRFELQRADEREMTLSLRYPAVHPLEKLHHVSFVEFSFLAEGMLYYALVELLELETKRFVCTLRLSAPESLSCAEQRRFGRVAPQARTPVTCRIAGIRQPAVRNGVVFTGQIVDISTAAISFVTTARLLCPMFLEMTFVLPHVDHKMIVYGEIIRLEHFGSDAYRVAVRFHQPQGSVIHDIETFCRMIQASC